MTDLEISYFEKLEKTVDSCTNLKHMDSMICYIEYIIDNDFYSIEYRVKALEKVKELLITFKQH